MDNPISRQFNTVSLLRFVLPSMIMMLFISIYTMTGSIYAGNFINQRAMAAINIAAPLFSSVIAVAVMFATGSNAIIAKNLGQGSVREAREKFTYLFIVAIITGIFLTAFVLTFDEGILRFLGSTPELDLYSREYLRTLALTFPFVFLQIFGQYFTVTLGRPVLGLVFAVISTISNLTITHITIVKMDMGVRGAAMGLGSSFIFPAIIFTILLSTRKDWILHFVRPRRYKGFMSEVCFNGSSEMVTNLAISAVTMTLNILMGRLRGEDGIAAVAVIVSLQFFLNSMYIGFGAGVAPIFSFAQGTGDRKQTKSVFKISTRFVGLSSLLLVILCVIFKGSIVEIFIRPESPAYTLAMDAFSIFSLGYLFAGMNIFASVFFTSASNGKISALISILRTFIFILGMLAILPRVMGVRGVWMSIPVAEAMAVVVSISLFRRYRRVYHY